KKANWSTGLPTLLTLIKYRFWTRNIGKETLYRIARMRRFNWFIYQQMQSFIGKRILEAGCGIGTFTPFFPQAEYYIGIDKEERFIEKLRETYAEFPQFEFRVEDLDTLEIADLRSKNLDTILCINVLEHLEKDEVILEKFHQILSPGGKLILLVPAMPGLYSSLDKELGHYRRYKLSALKKTIRKTGFQIVHQQYFNSFGVLGWWFNGKILRRRLLPNRQLHLYESLAPFFLRLERKLHLPFGLSIFLVAQKV
ncbi:MAG: class I SAM-dependent methyltransferase, partial [Candidatus Sumerlaeia bacterium]|nr:class I SAM-dependent methyltransferase [Candidatus Sumerlaeia bacterium]